MSLGKRFLRHPQTQIAIACLITALIRLVYASSRKSWFIDDKAKSYMAGADNGIFAFWHGRMFVMLPIAPPGRIMRVLSSHHRDGRFTSNIIGRFGQATIDGSSKKGGRKAVAEMLRALKAGDNVCITPDGPRGPVQIATQGIIAVARLSGKPVVPVAFSSTRFIRLKTWDRFMLALPFGRITFCVGDPIIIERDMQEGGEEQTRLRVEQTMNALVEKADSLAHA